MTTEWESSEDVQAKATEWLRKLDGNIILDYKTAEKNEGFIGAAINGSSDTMYTLNCDGWYVTLGLQGQLQADNTAASLQERLKFIALDKVPTPGLEVIGWEIKPMTPVSSFQNGVEIPQLRKRHRHHHREDQLFLSLWRRQAGITWPAASRRKIA